MGLPNEKYGETNGYPRTFRRLITVLLIRNGRTITGPSSGITLTHSG